MPCLRPLACALLALPLSLLPSTTLLDDPPASPEPTRAVRTTTDVPDHDRLALQLGAALHGALLDLPCHPRLELVSLVAARPAPGLTPAMIALVAPEELRPALADGALVVRAEWRDPEVDLVATVRLTRTEGDDAIAVEAGDPATLARFEELLEQGHCPDGPLSDPVLRRPLEFLPEGWSEQDEAVGLWAAEVGPEYASDKGDAAWARRVEGRQEFTGTWLAAGEDLWTASIFELEREEDAAEVHDRLYGAPMRRALQTGANTWARQRGLDAVYRTRLSGRPAWYVDRRNHDGRKELNLVVGTRIVALGSWVLDADPLLMDDLLDRAALLPLLER
jgi:hypothetical protein